MVGVKDHFSRRVLALVPFKKQPTAAEIAAVLDLAVRRQGCAPRHIVSDKGSQFWNCKARKPARIYADWLDEHGVRPRFGAVGQHGSIAIIERFWRTLKQQGIRRMLVPYRLDAFTDELEVFREWFNSRRPHSTLSGATPDDVAVGRSLPKQRARLETRARYPVSASDVESGNVWRVNEVELHATGFRGRRHLPDVRLDFAA